MGWFGVYWFVISVITFLVYGIDKWQAKHKFRRIPETTLMGFAVIGGAIGAFWGMLMFRHKIKKYKFSIGLPVIMVVQTAVFIWMLISYYAE